MEIAILILSVIMLAISAACLFYVTKIARKVEDRSNDRNNEAKLAELRESIYNEFSRNRNEQNNSALTQRKELEAKLLQINTTLDNIKTTNQDQLMRIFREITVGLAKIDETLFFASIAHEWSFK